MTDETKTSRPELLLAGGGVAIVIAAAAWFVLGGSGDDEAELAANVAQPIARDVAQDQDIAVAASSGESVAALLNKARMASSADMLAEPAGQNALYFYSLALEAEPDNAEARAELADVSTEVATEIRSTIEAREFVRASELVQRLEIADPNATVIPEYYDTVANERASLSDRALQAANAGKQKQVDSLVASLTALPGTDGATLKALSERLTAARAKRDADRREAAKLAAEKAKPPEPSPAPVVASSEAESEDTEARPEVAAVSAPEAPDWEAALEEVNEQVASGSLLGEGGALASLQQLSAKYPNEEKIDDARQRAIQATAAKVQRDIAFEQLSDAQAGIDALEVSQATSQVAGLRESLQLAQARIDARVPIPASRLTAVEIVPPVYPRAAKRKNIEGWVEVEFTVNPQGRVENIEVVKTSNSNTFNRATIQAVSQWQFEPQMFNGQPIPQRVATRLAFQFTG